MADLNIEKFHERLTNVEAWKGGASNDIKSLKEETKALKKTMIVLESDMETIKQKLINADAARDRQTDILLSAIDDTRKRAFNQVPAWASTLITVLAMICAALLTAFYHR